MAKDKVRDREIVEGEQPEKVKKSKKDKKEKKEKKTKKEKKSEVDDIEEIEQEEIEEAEEVSATILSKEESLSSQINNLFDKITNFESSPITNISEQLKGLNTDTVNNADLELISNTSQNLLKLYDNSLQLLKSLHFSNSNLNSNNFKDSNQVIQECYNSIELNQLKDLMSVQLYQPLTQLNNELKYSMLALTKDQTVANVLTPTLNNTNIEEKFREFYMENMANAFGDELDEIRQLENLDEDKIKILIQSLEIGINNFSGEEKELQF